MKNGLKDYSDCMTEGGAIERLNLVCRNSAIANAVRQVGTRNGFSLLHVAAFQAVALADRVAELEAILAQHAEQPANLLLSRSASGVIAPATL